MSWGTRRRNTIIFLVVIFLLLPITIGGFLIFYEPPNCFDGKQNGKESGIDCGGNCVLLCTTETLPPIVVWQRFFEVSPGIYNALAYIENPNPSAGIKNLEYTFKFFNNENVLIAERPGKIRLYPKSILPVIESNIRTFNQDPNRVSFELNNDIVFEQEKPAPKILIVKDENIESVDPPKITASIENIELSTVIDIDVIVLLYDVFDNVIGSSSTYIEKLGSGESVDIVFTWPNSFEEEISRLEIVPIYESNIQEFNQ